MQWNNPFTRLDQRQLQRFVAAMDLSFCYETNNKTLNASRLGLMEHFRVLRLTPTPSRNPVSWEPTSTEVDQRRSRLANPGKAS